MTRAECVLFLISQRNVPDELFDAKEVRITAIEFVNSLAVDQLPANEDELQDAYIDWLESLLGDGS